METSIVRVVFGGLFASCIFLGGAESRPQYLPPVACIGLAAAACTEATDLLRDQIRQYQETYQKYPEKWEIASEPELARISKQYPTREGRWFSNATFALFLEPSYGALHTCAPSQVILASAAIKNESDMAYLRGYIDGACEGTSQYMLFEARRRKP